MKKTSLILMALVFFQGVSRAGDFTCSDPFLTEQKTTVKATDTHYQITLGGDKSVEAFLKASGVTAPADAAGTRISFELPKADCTSSKESPYAINCSGRQVQLSYSPTETIEVAFLNLNVVDRTDTSGVGSARSIIIELQNIDIGLTSGKYVFARYYRDLPIDYCFQ